jgi:hypothetical protein
MRNRDRTVTLATLVCALLAAGCAPPPDSSTVAYLLQDARLIAVAAGSGRIVADGWLVDHRDYPPREMACQLALSNDGRTVTYIACQRHGPRCSDQRTESLE